MPNGFPVLTPFCSNRHDPEQHRAIFRSVVNEKRRYAMGDKGKKDKDKARKQKIKKQEQTAKKNMEKLPTKPLA
jgi:hypothetical protein